MSTKVKVEMDGRYVMPPVCCACGARAGSWTVLETASDLAIHSGISIHFPLCEDCGVLEQRASGWRGQRGLLRTPPHDRARFERMDGAVRIRDYRPLEADAPLTLEFTNARFAQLFAKANARPLRRRMT